MQLDIIVNSGSQVGKSERIRVSGRGRETLLVTGGAGFIGSNFVRHLLDRTSAVIVVLDSLSYAGNFQNLDGVLGHRRVRFVRGDIRDRKLVESVYRDHRPDAVVNFAAESHVDRSIDGPRSFVDTNIVGAFELLEGARHHVGTLPSAARVRFRFLQVSTDEVYGSLGSEGAFSENTPYAPNSPYAASKAAADHLMRAYHRTYSLPVLLTNCSNNYGPYQFPEKLVPLMILNALEGEPLPIYGDGSNVRDWLFVEDHCEALLAVLTGGVPGEKYNIGGGTEVTNLEMVDRLCALLEEVRPARSNPALAPRGVGSYAELKSFVADRPGHDRRYAIDAHKIERELGWKPRHGFEEGLRRTLSWYLDNEEWCAAAGCERHRLGLGREAAR